MWQSLTSIAVCVTVFAHAKIECRQRQRDGSNVAYNNAEAGFNQDKIKAEEEAIRRFGQPPLTKLGSVPVSHLGGFPAPPPASKVLFSLKKLWEAGGEGGRGRLLALSICTLQCNKPRFSRRFRSHLTFFFVQGKERAIGPDLKRLKNRPLVPCAKSFLVISEWPHGQAGGKKNDLQYPYKLPGHVLYI